jgi:hypothetical protein
MWQCDDVIIGWQEKIMRQFGDLKMSLRKRNHLPALFKEGG